MPQQGIETLFQASNYDSATLKAFLESHPNIDPNAPDKLGRIVALELARQGKSELLKTLLADSRTKVDTVDKFGWSALHIAAFCGFSEGIQILLQHGATINLPDKTGHTPLHLAISQSRNGGKAAKVLLAHQADVNCICNDEDAGLHKATPLHLAAIRAAHYKEFELLGELVKYGANLNAKAANCIDNNNLITARELYHGRCMHQFGVDIEAQMQAFDMVVKENLPAHSPATTPKVWNHTKSTLARCISK